MMNNREIVRPDWKKITHDKKIDLTKNVHHDKILNDRIKSIIQNSNFILNYANEEGAGFESDTNHLYIYSKSGDSIEFEKNTNLFASSVLNTSVHPFPRFFSIAPVPMIQSAPYVLAIPKFLKSFQFFFWA